MNEIIIGIHSIIAALKNSNRNHEVMYLSDETKDELLKSKIIDSFLLEKVDHQILSTHKIQEEAKKYFKKYNYEYVRVPSNIFLITSMIEPRDINWLYTKAEKEKLKILCLDQISDVHNAAAIFRTASFYGVDILVIPSKKSFGMSPSFYRIASGAAEFLDVVPVSNLSKTITKLNSFNIPTIALSEHAETEFSPGSQKSVCLIVGKEDTGISNAVMRVASERLSLPALGNTKSLNVSVAAAIAMEKCFNVATN